MMYEFGLFGKFKNDILHAVFTRHADMKNLPREYAGGEPVRFYKQLHGANAYVITERIHRNIAREGLKGDALITGLHGVPLLIRIADCAGILIYDPRKKIIANIHAGWRGLAGGVIASCVDRMRAEFSCDPRNMFAAISPMLGPCCAKFSDPKNELPSFMQKYILEGNKVDLWAAAEDQLRDCGIKTRNIENARICTSCNISEFFSYRREGGAGRFGTMIMLK